MITDHNMPHEDRVAIEASILLNGVAGTMRKFGLDYEIVQAVKHASIEGVPYGGEDRRRVIARAVSFVTEAESSTPTCWAVDDAGNRCNRTPHAGGRHRCSAGRQVVAEWSPVDPEDDVDRVWPAPRKPKAD